MITAASRSDLFSALGAAGSGASSDIAFVPTMGALHDGHLSLVRMAVQTRSTVVASIFVNPLQFGPNEDLAAYPRTEQSDAEMLEAAGCDVLYLPTVEDIYPAEFSTKVTACTELSGCLCGATRDAGHFDGVTTVVARLFGLVQPSSAWFGEKDWQQLQVIRRMAGDIFPHIEIKAGATVRDAHGLALSSRNARLSASDRETAIAVPRSLTFARKLAQTGAQPQEIEHLAKASLSEAGISVDYFEIRGGAMLEPISHLDENTSKDARVFVAVRIGGIRLIDNSALTGPNPELEQAVSPKTSMASTASAAVTG